MRGSGALGRVRRHRNGAARARPRLLTPALAWLPRTVGRTSTAIVSCAGSNVSGAVQKGATMIAARLTPRRLLLVLALLLVPLVEHSPAHAASTNPDPFCSRLGKNIQASSAAQ